MGEAEEIWTKVSYVADDFQEVMTLKSNSTITAPMITQMQNVSGIRTFLTNTMINVVFFLGILSI